MPGISTCDDHSDDLFTFQVWPNFEAAVVTSRHVQDLFQKNIGHIDYHFSRFEPLRSQATMLTVSFDPEQQVGSVTVGESEVRHRVKRQMAFVEMRDQITLFEPVLVNGMLRVLTGDTPDILSISEISTDGRKGLAFSILCGLKILSAKTIRRVSFDHFFVGHFRNGRLLLFPENQTGKNGRDSPKHPCLRTTVARRNQRLHRLSPGQSREDRTPHQNHQNPNHRPRLQRTHNGMKQKPVVKVAKLPPAFRSAPNPTI